MPEDMRLRNKHPTASREVAEQFIRAANQALLKPRGQQTWSGSGLTVSSSSTAPMEPAAAAVEVTASEASSSYTAKSTAIVAVSIEPSSIEAPHPWRIKAKAEWTPERVHADKGVIPHIRIPIPARIKA